MKSLTRVSLLGLTALLTVACTSDDQLRRSEQELGDLKVEVFKLRQAQEEAAKKAEAEQLAAAQARAQDRRFQADLQESLRQVQETVRVINNKVGAAPRPSTAAPVQSPVVTAPSSEEDKAFQSAVVDYNKGSYALAAEGFQLFAKSYGSSARRSEALFYLGLCQYNQKAYDKAQPVFEQILREHAGSPQFLPAKLKRGQCLLKQGLKPAAAKAFKELVDGFQGTPEARTAQQELADLGL